MSEMLKKKKQLEALFKDDFKLIIREEDSKWEVNVSDRLTLKEYADILSILHRDLLNSIHEKGTDDDMEYYYGHELKQLYEDSRYPVFTFRTSNEEVVTITSKDVNEFDLVGTIINEAQEAVQKGVDLEDIIGLLRVSLKNSKEEVTFENRDNYVS